jgi:hypothetical protein
MLKKWKKGNAKACFRQGPNHCVGMMPISKWELCHLKQTLGNYINILLILKTE